MGSLVDVMVQSWMVMDRDDRVVVRTWGTGTDLLRTSGGSDGVEEALGKTVWIDEVVIRGAGGSRCGVDCHVRGERLSRGSLVIGAPIKTPSLSHPIRYRHEE